MSKNEKTTSFYLNSLAFKNKYGDSYLMHETPGHNLTTLNDIVNKEEISQNLPVYGPLSPRIADSKCFLWHIGQSHEDYIQIILDKKAKWRGTIDTKYHYKHLKNLKKLRKNKEHKLKHAEIRILNQISKEPEPIFQSHYYWFNSGGSLTSVGVEDNYLVGCEGSKIIWYNNKGEDIRDFQMKIDQPVLEIKSNNNLVCARQKKNVIIVNDDLHVIMKKKSPNGYLTSIDMSSERVAVCDTAFKIRIFDVHTKKIITKNNIPKRNTKWNQIILQDQDIFAANVDRMYHFDLRSKVVVTDVPCTDVDQISYIYKHEHYLFIGSHQTVIKYDTRIHKKVFIWRHLLEYPPVFGGYFEEDDAFIVGNQFNKVVLVKENSAPYLLSNGIDTLKNYNLIGNFLSPQLKDRLNLSINGLYVNPNGIIYTQNTGGDIFMMDLKNKINENIIFDSFENYEKEFGNNKVVNSPLQITNAFNTDYLNDILLEPIKRKSTNKKKDKHWSYDEMCSTQSLKLYKDVMAKNTLSIWSVSSDDSDEEQTVDEEMPVEVKVSEWLMASTSTNAN